MNFGFFLQAEVKNGCSKAVGNLLYTVGLLILRKKKFEISISAHFDVRL